MKNEKKSDTFMSMVMTKWGHKAQECLRRKSCTLCSDRKHKKVGCPYQRPPKVEVEVEVEVHKDVEELGKMTLLDRIARTGPHQFVPNVANSNLVTVRWSAPDMSIAGDVGSMALMGLLTAISAR